MVSIYVLLIVFLITVLVVAVVGWLRRPELLRKIALIVSGTLLGTNLARLFLGAQEFWQTAKFTATLAGVAPLGVVMTALRTGGVPARQRPAILCYESPSATRDSIPACLSN